MSDITKIPINDLLNDYAESISDMAISKVGLNGGLKTYGGGMSIQELFDVSLKIAKKIKDEIIRRVEKEAP